MKCAFCGNEIPDGAAYCGFCNARVERPAAQPQAQQAQQPPQGQWGGQTQQRQQVVMQPQSSQQVRQPLQGQWAAPAQQPQGQWSAPVQQAMPAPAMQKPQNPPANSGAQAASKKKSRAPIFIAVAVVAVVAIVAVVVGVFVLGGAGQVEPSNGTEETAVPEAAKPAIEDASALASELIKAEQGGDSDLESNADALERINDDLSALEETGSDWAGYSQAHAAMENIQEAIEYYMAMEEAEESVDVGDESVDDMLLAVQDLYVGYSDIEAPDFLQHYLENTLDAMPTLYAALLYVDDSSQSILSQYTAVELYEWWMVKQDAYDTEASEVIVKQLDASREMLDNVVAGSVITGSPKVEVNAIDEIAPNLYPSLDSALILAVTSYDDSHSIIVTAEVTGFTQKFEQKYDLAQGCNYLSVKPALLPTSQMTNLDSNSTTQFEIKVVDADDGAVLAQESHEVSLLSMYDFQWVDDEFGATAAFDVLAWLRPNADEVSEVNRRAADVLGEWTNGKYKTIAGYQFGDDWSATLLQVAAIQTAISDMDVAYVNDAFSFASDQHILTPDQVIQKEHGLCIETSLLMASCLMSANMHPLIIITPGHAQVAVETYTGSGEYFLIETTELPYSGVNMKYDYDEIGFWNGLLASVQTKDGKTYVWTANGTSDEWEEYFAYAADDSDDYGGIFVIDCSLQPVMDIQGIETL